MRRRYDQISETPVAQSADGLAFLAGLYLAMSPWVIGFTDHSALTVTNLFTGVAIALLAVGFVAGSVPETAAVVSNVIVGAVALVCALAMMSTGMRRGARK